MAATYEEGIAQTLPIDDKGNHNFGLFDPSGSKFYHPRAESATNPNLRVTLYDGATKLTGAGLAVDTEMPAAAALTATVARGASTTTIAAVPRLDDGTNVVMQASNSAANMAGTTQPAAAMVANPGQWSAYHNPGANTIATISKAAGTSTQRHVLTGFSFVVTSGATAPTAAVVTCNLRDGATGAGTILKQWTIGIQATAGATQGLVKSGLSILGSAATAMTLEFTGAGGANTYEMVEIEGYTTA